MEFTASDLANWWDRQHKESKQILKEFVDEHPNWWGIGIATLTETTMELGAGMVDVLRLGKGAAEGGVNGYAQDAIRFVSILGPAGKLFKVVQLSKYANLSKLLVDPGGNICTWMASASALRRVGASLYVTLEDLAKAAPSLSKGMAVAKMEAVWASELIAAMESFGAKAIKLRVPKRIADVSNVLQNANNKNSVVMFAIKWNSLGGEIYYTIYAFKNAFGLVRFTDRTHKIFSNLDDLVKIGLQFTNAGKASLYSVEGAEMVLVQGVKILQLPSGLAVLALSVTKKLGLNTDEISLDEMKKEYEGFKSSKISPNTRTDIYSK